MRERKMIDGRQWVNTRKHGWLPEGAVWVDDGRGTFIRGRFRHVFLESDPWTCPACGERMEAVMIRPRASDAERLLRYRHRRSRGHIHPKTGWPTDVPRPWVWLCQQCNIEQSGKTLWEWLAVLREKRDPRAERLAVLCERLAQYEKGAASCDTVTPASGGAIPSAS